jgi:hypothetical protein
MTRKQTKQTKQFRRPLTHAQLATAVGGVAMGTDDDDFMIEADNTFTGTDTVPFRSR